MSLKNILTSDFLSYTNIKCQSMECLQMIVDSFDIINGDIDNLIVNNDLNGTFTINNSRTLLDTSVNSVLLNDAISGIELNNVLANNKKSLEITGSSIILQSQDVISSDFIKMEILPAAMSLSCEILGNLNSIYFDSTIIQLGSNTATLRTPSLTDGLLLANGLGILSTEPYDSDVRNLQTIPGNRIPGTHNINYQVLRFGNIVFCSGVIFPFTITGGAGVPTMDLPLPIEPPNNFNSDVLNGASAIVSNTAFTLVGTYPYMECNIGAKTIKMRFGATGSGDWVIKFNFTYLLQ